MTNLEGPCGMAETGGGLPDVSATKCPECPAHAVFGRSPTARAIFVAALTAWVLAAFGALMIAEIPGDFGESLCGVWGCLPPMQALVAMHLFWLVLLVPPAALAGLRLPRLAAIRLGVLLVLVGAAAAVVVVGLDVARWLSAMEPELHGFAGRHALYSLATHTDAPMMQAVVAGAIGWGIAWRRTGERMAS